MPEILPPPGTLYGLLDLIAGFDPSDPKSIFSTISFRQYQAYYPVKIGGAQDIVRVANAATHDARISEALFRYLQTRVPTTRPVGIMGGHGVSRDSEAYVLMARIGRLLTQCGFLVVTGGGPGLMEAAHLGAYFANCDDAEFTDALGRIGASAEKRVPQFPAGSTLLKKDGTLNVPVDEAYTERLHRWFLEARAVQASCTQRVEQSLAIPTWEYGDEPVMPFATAYAAFFENSIREDSLIHQSQAGVIYGQGGGGTIREIFQDVEENYYVKTTAQFTPMIFCDPKDFWNPTTATASTIKLDDTIERMFIKAFSTGGSPTVEWNSKVAFTKDPQSIVSILRMHSQVSNMQVGRLFSLPSRNGLGDETARIILGTRQEAEQLFAYPNAGHEDQTLEETIEHYLNDSLTRDGLPNAKSTAQVSENECAVTIDASDAANIARSYQSFFDIGKQGLEATDAFRSRGQWDAAWRFFLPLGISIAEARAVEIMDFPPVTLIKNQDYLKSRTTNRWWELLALNDVSREERARYSCILDIVPVAAPASDGQKLKDSGIYDGPFDHYGFALLELLSGANGSIRRPLIALGLPIREWIQRNWKLTLKILDVASIKLTSGAECAVIASNHPSFFYYAVNFNADGSPATEKNLAAGLAVMKQDIVAAAWHAAMGRKPGAVPAQVLSQSQQQWANRDAELLAITKKQAGVSSLLDYAIDSTEFLRNVPSDVQLLALEKCFYAGGIARVAT